MRDLNSHITAKRMIAEAVVTSSPAAVVIDRATVNNNLYEGLVFDMYVGPGGIAFTGTNFIALRLEDSDDGVTYANVTIADNVVRSTATAAAAQFGQNPDNNGYVRLINAAKAAADTDPFAVSYVGNKRYIRATIVFVGTHATGTLVSLWAILGFPRLTPAA